MVVYPAPYKRGLHEGINLPGPIGEVVGAGEFARGHNRSGPRRGARAGAGSDSRSRGEHAVCPRRRAGQISGTPEAGSAITAIIIAVVIASMCLSAKEALLAVAVTVAGAAAMAVLAWRQIGGVTGDVFGATEQVAETAVLIMLAARLS